MGASVEENRERALCRNVLSRSRSGPRGSLRQSGVSAPEWECDRRDEAIGDEEGALTITSSGRRFGDPGFYFTVHGQRVRARYVRTMRETIRVYPAEEAGEVRPDHILRIWGTHFSSTSLSAAASRAQVIDV